MMRLLTIGDVAAKRDSLPRGSSRRRIWAQALIIMRVYMRRRQAGETQKGGA